MWNEKKRKPKDILKTLLWSSKFGYSVSPVLYSLKFAQRLLTAGLPILEAYYASKVIGGIVTLLSTESPQMNSDLIRWVILSVIAIALRGITAHIGDYLNVRYNYVYNLKAFSMYLQQVVSIDAQYHEDPKFKTLQDKAYDVIAWRIMALINRIQGLTASILGLALISYIFVQVNPLFIAAIFVPVLLNFYINNKYGREIFYIWEYGGEEAKHINHAFHAFDDKSVVHEAKIYGFGTYIINIFTEFTRIFMKRNIRKSNVRYLLLTVAKAGEVSIFGAIQFKLVQEVVSGAISVQQYSFYLQNVGLISMGFNSIQDDVAQLIELSQYVDNLRLFFILPPKIVRPRTPVQVSLQSPKIEFRKVSFHYPSSKRYILQNISFTIQPGEHVALVGVNGAGKSTIIKLLARFYDVTDGEILINDVNIKEIDLPSYYKLWGILFQQFARYWLSVRENIGLGSIADIENRELIEKAGERAGVDAIVKQLPRGYETMLSSDMEGGTDLSGGQWQKIGIARGLFSDPQLIILDEPTSALDALSEAEVFDRISQISSETTMIIVSHRFSTVRNADKILVLDGGHIIEAGTHEDLIKKKGHYEKMFSSQARGYR